MVSKSQTFRVNFATKLAELDLTMVMLKSIPWRLTVLLQLRSVETVYPHLQHHARNN